MKKLNAKRLLLLMLITALVASFASPVVAGDGLLKGTKVVLSPEVTAEFLGKNPDGTYQWRATISAPQYLDDLTTPIECRWDYDVDKGEWFTRANLFSAIVKGTKVTVEYEGQKLSWQPDVTVGTKKQAPWSPSAQLLIDDPINENYHGNTLRWLYDGFTRNLRVIEGMLIEYYTIDTLPVGDILIVPHTTKDAGFVWTRPSEAWDAEGKPVELLIGKDGELLITLEAIVAAIFPITIDPDTSFTTSSSDGSLERDGTPYTAVHSASTAEDVYKVRNYMAIGQKEYAGGRAIYRSCVFFNTASLPDDCSVDSATLKFDVYLNQSTTDFNIVVQSGMPTYPHDPLVAGDYLYTHCSGDGGSLNTSTMLCPDYGYCSLVLNATGRGWIDKTGWTKFYLRSDEDINVSEPTTFEYVYVYTYEKGDGYWPTLEVTYSASAAPTITTDDASDIAYTSARLNSTLVDDGGGDVEVRWGYGTTTQTAGNFANYDTVTSWEGEYTSGQHPYYDAGSLVEDTPYFFRVQARNDEGTTTGGEKEFTTLSSLNPPTNFRAVSQAPNIALTWTKGVGSTQTLVRFAYGDYPATTSDGWEIYEGTSTTYMHTGLDPGITVYYSAWGESGGGYSGSKATTMTTTSAGEEEGAGLETPPAPTGWMQSPDPTAMENVPFVYDAVNGVADSLEMPRATFWLVLTLIILVGLALILYVYTHSLLISVIALAGGMCIAVFQELLPFWMIIIVIIMGVGLGVTRARAGV